ncbi:lysophospholipid acyltransferase family protein [Persicirhabdus sediminis]|uniref:Lysophospholipid acyltransferase family protein n=1 Tax=Persicirhabdus sediminis TaxID=454144 RepID=A0A8J7ME70_9BACT|nr:lysophospholipid acyltransferase family protein [Persicirhabdus sediminis]MBK1790189.1 lysophospholipid acyltransferase family protein [Persicirhabdus sediminis]
MAQDIRGSKKERRIGTAIGWLIRLYCLTLRYSVTGHDRIAAYNEQNRGVIALMWHNRLFSILPAWDRTRSKIRCTVLTSASKDGAMLAGVAGVYGHAAVRGSSSRRGVAALIALQKLIRAGENLFITPDGPRGPMYHMHAGALKLAESSGAPIVPVHIKYQKVWRLKTWDSFMIPVPFTKVDVEFAEAIEVPHGLDNDQLEDWRSRIEETMKSAALAGEPAVKEN